MYRQGLLMQTSELENIEMIFFFIGYILVGTYIAVHLRVDSTIWLYFFLHLISGMFLFESTIKIINELSIFKAPSLIFLLINSVYYIISSIKYFAEIEHYPQFSITTQERFYGSLAVCLSLFVCLCFIKWISGKVRKIIEVQYIVKFIPKLTHFLLWFLLVNILLKALLINQGYQPSYFSDQPSYLILPYSGLIFLAAETITSQIVLILSAVIIVIPEGGPRILGLILSLISIALNLFWGLFLRARYLLMFPIVSIGIIILLTKRPIIARRFWRWSIFILFVMNSLGGDVIMELLGRPHLYGSDAIYTSVAEIGYRLDLSDFAFACIRHGKTSTFNFSLIFEGIMNMIPRTLWPTKEFDSQYNIALEEMGWPAIDYPDTFFSTGALTAGWLGFFLVPIFFLIYVEFGYRIAFYFIKYIGSDIGFVISFFYLLVQLIRIEMDWNLFFLYHFRNPILGILLICLTSFFTRFKRKGNNYHMS